jgi:RNA polymerase sigma-70 factor (ECF subfamily)
VNKNATSDEVSKGCCDPSSEFELVAAVVAGDTDAYGTLVERYQDRLYHSLWGILGSPEDARDVAQEALVQAYLKLNSFRAESRFYTWLYRIAMNLALSYRRRKRPTMSMDQVREQTGSEPAARQVGPEGMALRQEQIEQVWAALDRLPCQAREILVLRELEGCSYETIGEILELPVGTVRSRLFRARLQLRGQLQDRLSGGSE